MTIRTDSQISLAEANRDFSKAARLADENGTAVILQDHTPKYVLVEFSQLEKLTGEAEEPTVEAVGRSILARHRAAFEELAK